MNVTKVVSYWQNSSKEDFEAAQILFDNKKYSYCLFFCHLFIEKILKAVVVKKTKIHVRHTHNLGSLALETPLSFSQKQLELLDIITTFNIQARYDTIKFKFHKKATKEYTEKFFNESKHLYKWIADNL
jgi:HEPN domain-containing protein